MKKKYILLRLWVSASSFRVAEYVATFDSEKEALEDILNPTLGDIYQIIEVYEVVKIPHN